MGGIGVSLSEQKLRMSREELKRERKDDEGDPHVIQRFPAEGSEAAKSPINGDCWKKFPRRRWSLRIPRTPCGRVAITNAASR